MARRVQGPVSGRVDWYTPEAEGNRLEPDKDRVRVRLRMPTEADKRLASSRSIGKRDIDGDEVRAGAYITMGQELARTCVVSVENYEKPDGALMVDGDDWADHAETSFVQEVGEVLFGALELTSDWCKVCGTNLPDGSKVCVNETCASKEIEQGEELPSEDSLGSNPSETRSDGPSVPEGQRSAPVAVPVPTGNMLLAEAS